MTKPITSVAALMLVDEGRLALSDPIADYAPEFAHTRVLRSPDGPLEATDPLERPITFEDLLTHRAGLTYGDFQRGPIALAYREALGGDIDSDVPPDDWIARLARLPLIGQPGSAMYYGRSTDLLGLLIARNRRRPARNRAAAAYFRSAEDERHGLLCSARKAGSPRRRIRFQ
jgi:CubicO group peptidase (beta-lactamase class C family)